MCHEEACAKYDQEYDLPKYKVLVLKSSVS